MLKSDLIQRLATENPHLRPVDLVRAVEAVLQTLHRGLSEGRRIELRGFGSFAPTVRRAYVGRNPKSGERVEVPDRLRLGFRAGRALRQRLNPAPRSPTPPPSPG
ncbi:HU family DNA-binding protein [Brevundimonas sp.]|uniref:HU family DNA-binding protein n=1 Tax=Brevundimonas sp. TaxID=1871086 RepID=UPI003F728C28